MKQKRYEVSFVFLFNHKFCPGQFQKIFFRIVLKISVQISDAFRTVTDEDAMHQAELGLLLFVFVK